MPFAVPPAQFAVGGGTVNRIPHEADETESTEYGETGGSHGTDHMMASMRASVHPLQLFRPQRHRQLDLGVGYTAETIGGLRTTIHGPYVQLDHYPWVRADGSWTKRLGLRANAELLYPGSSLDLGLGATLALLFELGSFAEGAFAAAGGDSAIAGVAYGEGAIGGYFGASYRTFGDEAYWFPSLGVYGRIPAVAGVICCHVDL